MKTEKSFSDFEAVVAQMLSKAKIPYEQQARIGGLQADFVIETPGQRKIIVEALGMHGTWGEGLGRLRSRLNYFKEATGAHRVLFCVPDGSSHQPETGLLHPKELANVILNEIDQEAVNLPENALATWHMGQSNSKEALQRKKNRTVFAAMPFAPQYEDTFFLGMVPAAKSVKATCVRVDQEKFQGDIVTELSRMIGISKAMIADVSEPNPNVFFEAGYAHALRIPVIQISSSSRQLPFDVRNMKTLPYKKGQCHKLKKILVEQLRSIFESSD